MDSDPIGFDPDPISRAARALQELGLKVKELNSGRLSERVVDWEVARLASFEEIDRTSNLQTKVRQALEIVLQLGKPVSQLCVDDLLSLQRPFLKTEMNQPFRLEPDRAVVPAPAGGFTPPEMIPRSLDRFFEWVRSPAFAGLNPIEQMTLAQVRLNEIRPFAGAATAVVSLFSCIFPVNEGLLLPSWRIHEIRSFRDALELAYGFSTATLINFNLTALLRSYSGFTHD